VPSAPDGKDAKLMTSAPVWVSAQRDPRPRVSVLAVAVLPAGGVHTAVPLPGLP